EMCKAFTPANSFPKRFSDSHCSRKHRLPIVKNRYWRVINKTNTAIRVIFSMQIKSSPFLVQVLQTVIALFGLRNLLLFIHPTIVNPLNYLCLTTDGIFYCSLTLLVFPSSILNFPVCHCLLQ